MEIVPWIIFHAFIIHRNSIVDFGFGYFRSLSYVLVASRPCLLATLLLTSHPLGNCIEDAWRRVVGRMEGFLRSKRCYTSLYTLSMLIEACTGCVTAFCARFRQTSCRMARSTLLTVTRQHQQACSSIWRRVRYCFYLYTAVVDLCMT